jgi:hypothetical protein
VNGSDADDAEREDRHATVAAYYRALDAAGGAGTDDGTVEAPPALESLLAPGFVHVRPDRTLEGRDAFVRFMREERPVRETVHELEGLYDRAAGPSDLASEAARDSDSEAPTGDVVARGTLRGADGGVLFRFADAFTLDDAGRVVHLATYTD